MEGGRVGVFDALFAEESIDEAVGDAWRVCRIRILGRGCEVFGT